MILLLLLLILAPAATADGSRIYFNVNSHTISTAHTHVRFTGKVSFTKHELDGDTHIRLIDSTGFIVAECIPQLPCTPPKTGSTCTVYGISRYDSKHKWAEIHPVERLHCD